MPGARPIQVEMYLAQASAFDADGFLVVQPDGFGEQGCGFHENVNPYGLSSRPLDPALGQDGAPTAGCLLLTFLEGGQWMTLALTDKRVVDGYPPLQKGESMLYGPKFNFARCYADGSVGLFVTDTGTATGQSISLVMAPDGERHAGPWGTESFDANGWHLRTTSGARLDLGGIGGLPTPLDSLGSYVIIAAASAKVRASIINLGPDTAVFDGVAKSTPTLALFTAAQAVFSAITAGGLISASPGSPCVPNPTLAAALAAFGSALATAQATLPSACTLTG